MRQRTGLVRVQEKHQRSRSRQVPVADVSHQRVHLDARAGRVIDACYVLCNFTKKKWFKFPILIYH